MRKPPRVVKMEKKNQTSSCIFISNRDKIIRKILDILSNLAEKFPQCKDPDEKIRIKYAIHALEALLKIQGVQNMEMDPQEFQELQRFIQKMENLGTTYG